MCIWYIYSLSRHNNGHIIKLRVSCQYAWITKQFLSPWFFFSFAFNLVTRHFQVWICLLEARLPTFCRGTSPKDLACYVYNEEDHQFVYWGPNYFLHLVGLEKIPNAWLAEWAGLEINTYWGAGSLREEGAPRIKVECRTFAVSLK
jgi:hypothetical protein